MEILAHRGFWKITGEKNSLFSIENALKNGWGIETDIRDYCGKLVISHNIATEICFEAETVFSYYARQQCNSTLALNVKADGIQELVTEELSKYEIENYFLFDMSIPEMVVNAEKHLNFYTRYSDIEENCVMYEAAKGVWVDSFGDYAWLKPTVIERHLGEGKAVCIVSPELHGKDHNPIWKMLKDSKIYQSNYLKLCTDIPDLAVNFFTC